MSKIRQLDTLVALQTARTIELGPRPGKKRTCVRRPEASANGGDVDLDDDEVGDPGSPLQFPDSDDDLEKAEVAAFGRPVGLEEAMVDLDED